MDIRLRVFSGMERCCAVIAAMLKYLLPGRGTAMSSVLSALMSTARNGALLSVKKTLALYVMRYSTSAVTDAVSGCCAISAQGDASSTDRQIQERAEGCMGMEVLIAVLCDRMSGDQNAMPNVIPALSAIGSSLPHSE